MSRRRIVSEHDQREWLRRNVRIHRAAKGLSARAAGERVGMNLRHWQRIEAASSNVTLETLARLCNALEVDIVQLLREPSIGVGH